MSPTIEEKELLDDIFHELHREKVYVEYEGTWLEIQFSDIFVQINIHNGSVAFYDPNKNEQICRID